MISPKRNRCEGSQVAWVYRCRMKPHANDPSLDPVITFAPWYLRPIMLAGMAFAVGNIGRKLRNYVATFLQSRQRHCRRVEMNQCLAILPQHGQVTSPFFPHRRSRNIAKASASLILNSWDIDNVRAASERRKCCWVMREEYRLTSSWREPARLPSAKISTKTILRDPIFKLGLLFSV